MRVRLTPRSARNAIDGVKRADEPYVHARVCAVPEDGKANTALLELLAKTIGLPKSNLSVAAGASSRLKTVHIAGDTTALLERLTIWVEAFT